MDSHGLMAFQNIVWGSYSDSGFEEQPWALPLVLTPLSWICISNCIWPRRVYIPKSSLPTHVPIMNSNSYNLFCPSIRRTFWFLRKSSQFAVRRKRSLQWCFLHWPKRWLQQNVLQVLQAWELEEEIRNIYCLIRSWLGSTGSEVAGCFQTRKGWQKRGAGDCDGVGPRGLKLSNQPSGDWIFGFQIFQFVSE